MGSAFHWTVVVVTLLNIIACLWLIVWTTKQGDTEKEAMDTLDHTWDGDLQERNNPLPRWWLYLFVGTIVFGIAYLIYYPGLGEFRGVGDWTQVGQYESEREAIDAVYAAKFEQLAAMDFAALEQHDEAMEIAGRLFASHCATCHGSDAGGAIGYPNLTDDDWLYGGAPATITQTISNGRMGIMPPFEAVLGEDGARETVEYVKQLAGMDHEADLATAGQARYNTLCIGCHGPTGTGMQALGAPNLTDDVWVYGSSDAALLSSINVGRTGQMPAQSDLLSPEEIKLLTAYVLRLGGGSPAASGTP